MKFKTFIIAPIILVLLSSISYAQEKATSRLKQAQASTVLITIYDAQGNQAGQGSGFFINTKGDIITNWHVINSASSAMVKTATGAIFNVKGVVAKDEKRDIAKITLDAKDITFPYLTLSTIIPEIGERIFVVGNPYGLESTVSDGLISAIRSGSDNGQIIQISAPISPGSSGGPVINSENQVVGIATFQLVKGQNLNFAISSTEIVKLSKNNGSVTPLDELSVESEPYLSGINSKVQVKENEWIQIIDEFVIKQTPEEWYSQGLNKTLSKDTRDKLIEYDKKIGKIYRTHYTQIQFLQPCSATIIKSGDSIKDFQNITDFNLDYVVPKFRCDSRLKVFITYFSSDGSEIKTEGDFPLALKLDDNSRKTEMIPGEKQYITHFIPDDVVYWYVWVSNY